MNKQQNSIITLVLLLAALSTIGPFTVVTVLPAMGSIGRTFGTSAEQTQLVISLYSICFGLMNLLHGAVSDAIGRKKVIIVALSCYSVAAVVCAFSTSLTMLIAARMVQGLSGGAGAIVSRAIIRDCFEGKQAQKIMAYVTMIFSLAPAIAPIVGGKLSSSHFGWQGVFLFLSAFGVVLLFSSWIKLSRVYPAEQKKSISFSFLFSSYKQLLCKPAFILLSSALTFSFVGMYIFVHSAHRVLAGHFHIEETKFSILFIPLVIGIMSGSFFSGKLTNRLSLKGSTIVGYIIMLASALTTMLYHLFFPAHLWMVVIPLATYAFGAFFIVPAMMVTLLDIIPDLRGTASSLQSCMQSLCAGITSGFIAPLVWGRIFGLATTMLVVCLISLACAVGYFYQVTRQFPNSSMS